MAQAVQIADDDAGAHGNVRLRRDSLANQISRVNPAPKFSHHGTHFTGRVDLHLDAGRRISHRAAGSLNPADDFILHSAIFCLDYVSRHIWWEVKGLPANAFQDLFAGDLRVLRLSRWDAA
jgi:hypothetical protein